MPSAHASGYRTTVQEVHHQQPAEEHDLRHEENPHAQRGGFLLLLQRLEVVLQRRMMRVSVACPAEAGGGGGRIGVRGDSVRQL